MYKTDSESMKCMEIWGGNQAIDQSLQMPGLKVWVYSRPYGQAVGGGDVCYLSSCASGCITRMLLADVSGHGAAVSQVAVGLRDLMRRNINYIKQTRFVRAMNRQFTEFGDQDGFATALVCTFFAPTQTFALCNAGHPAPLLFRRCTSEWTELANNIDHTEAVTNTPLGVFDQAAYCQLDVQLQTGDMVLSFSDAVTESEDANGRQFGRDGILRLVRELTAATPGDVIPALVERITGLADRNLTQDDATIILCQATGGGPAPRDNLLAPFRLFGPVADRTKLS